MKNFVPVCVCVPVPEINSPPRWPKTGSIENKSGTGTHTGTKRAGDEGSALTYSIWERASSSAFLSVA